MKHEDLLKMLEETGDAAGFRMDRNAWYTLADIAKLHKPNAYDSEYCDVCWWEEHEREQYPCQTIQIIEKWLS